MNTSKISMPSFWLINFYYYYSNFSLFLTWFCTPFLLYIILTQSKKLKEYKWFILNHLFWCLAFETLIGSVKPLVLLPAFAGFPLSLIRESKSIFVTAIATMIGLLCCLNYVLGISATIASRYLTIFPSRFSKTFIIKCIVTIACISSAILSTLISAFLLPYIFANANSMLQDAKNYDIFFEEFIEPSLIFVDIVKIQKIAYFFFGIVWFFTILAVFVIIFFIHQVRTNMSKTTKMQKSLIISSTAQILITLLLLFIPLAVIITCVTLQIHHSSEAACICFCITSFHGICEFLATVYFVLPYRRYLKKQFLKIPLIMRNSTVHAAVVE